MPRTVDAVLFDFGGVFMESPFAAMHAFGEERLGIPGADAIAYVFGAYDDDTDHPWHRLERGELSLDAARQAILDLAARDGHQLDIYEALAVLGRSPVREGMIQAVRDVRTAGCKTAIVTNNIREFGAGWRQMLPIDDLFDAVVDSHEEGVRKPDPRIFLTALARVGGVPPERAVFLDDFAGNVAAAERLGLKGIVVGPQWERAVVELRVLVG